MIWRIVTLKKTPRKVLRKSVKSGGGHGENSEFVEAQIPEDVIAKN